MKAEIDERETNSKITNTRDVDRGIMILRRVTSLEYSTE
jgi:hypothetical protein